MHLSTFVGVCALAGASKALSDSLPWILMSTSAFNDAPNPSQIQAAAEVLRYTKGYLATCPTDSYLIVTQPGGNAADFRRTDAGCAMPHLCQAIDSPRVKATYSVAEVVGDVSAAGISAHIRSSCAKKGTSVEVNEISLDSLPWEHRAAELAQNDITLGQNIAALAGDKSYTILFYSTPAEPTYEPEFFESLHMDLRRDTHDTATKKPGNQKEWNKLPLFEKYQFFTPGIFMAIVTAIVLFSILGVGLRALSSLEVSYGAFEKDMGPAAQKKQQ